jgi:uncharacterized protein with FMN-binding domain
MRTSTLKSIAALALTGAGSALVVGFQTTDNLAEGTAGQANSAVTIGSTATSTGSNPTSSPATGSRVGSGVAPTATTAPASNGSNPYADGTWTGAAVSEPWGDFQVQVVIANGTITKVSVVESPSDRHSSRINSQAIPLLTESVLASQGTKVDMVSGATWTSDSYTTSLQAALDKAASAA